MLAAFAARKPAGEFHVISTNNVEASCFGEISLPLFTTALHRDRPNVGSPRTAPDEHVCYRTVDGVSAIRSVRATDNNKLWHYCSFASTSILLGPLG